MSTQHSTFNIQNYKAWIGDVVAVVVFAVLAFAYFYPADVEDRILYQHDTSAGAGAGQEASEYQKTHDGERTRWTNGLFSGMPTYQIAPSYDSQTSLSTIEKAYHLWLPDNVWYLFVYLLGFYILLRAFDFKQHLAALGSILWAFSTYFLIIIAAGHLWKVMALAYLPPMIAGVVLAYRGKYLLGLLVTAIFAALEVHANHVQMTYYYLFVILAMVIAFIVEALREKRYAHLLKATGVCLVGGLLGIMVNASNLYHTKQYEKESIRGGSELVKADSKDNTGGLERDKILAYSYGIGETWSLLIPNVQGGASMRGDAKSPTGTGLYPLGESSAAQAVANDVLELPDGRQFTYGDLFNQMPQYWGDGGTMGPVYVGALVILLFVLSLFVVKGPLKWGLLFVTILSVLLAWGSNFVGPSDFFINHVPLYAKFRTPESILVIAEFTIPLMAMLGLKRVVEEPECLTAKLATLDLLGCCGAVLVLVGIAQESALLIWGGGLITLAVMIVSVMKYYHLAPEKMTAVVDKQKPVTPLLLSLVLVGGVLLLFALFPGGFFDFIQAEERENFAGISGLMPTLESVRKSIFTADCWRSLAIVAVGAVALWLYAAKKLKALPMVAIIAVVCLFDLWQINKRYLNDSMFRDKGIKMEAHRMNPVDETLLKDKTLDYRVLNLTSSPFNENNTSYYHKSIGGYHAAKLGRYQDLIDSCLIPEMSSRVKLDEREYMTCQLVDMMNDSIADRYMPVLNMLNTRYFIVSNEANGAILNTHAFGNAWFVNKVTYVDNANDELAALHQIDLRHEAVADRRFESVLGSSPAEEGSVLGGSPAEEGSVLGGSPAEKESAATVKMESYEPNLLKYTVNSPSDGVLVFSEIYYPGWTATVDGKPAELGRVNYVLRALKVEPGQHQVELSFFPRSVKTTETVSYVAQAVFVLLVICACVLAFRNRKKKA